MSGFRCLPTTGERPENRQADSGTTAGNLSSPRFCWRFSEFSRRHGRLPRCHGEALGRAQERSTCGKLA